MTTTYAQLDAITGKHEPRNGDVIYVPAGTDPSYRTPHLLRVVRSYPKGGQEFVHGVVVTLAGKDRMVKGTPMDRTLVVKPGMRFAVVTPAPATREEIDAAYAEDIRRSRCDCVAGRMGCAHQDCEGVPPVAEAVHHVADVPAVADAGECGSVTFAREIAEAIDGQARMCGLDIRVSHARTAERDRYEGRGGRNYGVYTYAVNGHVVDVIGYFAGNGERGMCLHAVLVNGELISADVRRDYMHEAVSIARLVIHVVQNLPNLATLADVEPETSAEIAPVADPCGCPSATLDITGEHGVPGIGHRTCCALHVEPTSADAPTDVDPDGTDASEGDDAVRVVARTRQIDTTGKCECAPVRTDGQPSLLGCDNTFCDGVPNPSVAMDESVRLDADSPAKPDTLAGNAREFLDAFRAYPEMAGAVPVLAAERAESEDGGRPVGRSMVVYTYEINGVTVQVVSYHRWASRAPGLWRYAVVIDGGVRVAPADVYKVWKRGEIARKVAEVTAGLVPDAPVAGVVSATVPVVDVEPDVLGALLAGAGAPDSADDSATVAEVTAEVAKPFDVVVNGRKLADALSLFASLMPRTVPVPVLAGVMITSTGPDSVELSTFDYEVCVRQTLRACVTGTGSGRVLVNARALRDVLSKMPKGKAHAATVVTFAEVDGKVRLTWGTTSIVLPTLPAADLPALPDMGHMVGKVNPHAFGEAVRNVALSLGKDRTLPFMCMINIAPVEGGVWRLAATDRYRYGLANVPVSPVESPADAEVSLQSAMVPGDALAVVGKALVKRTGVVGDVTVWQSATRQIGSGGIESRWVTVSHGGPTDGLTVMFREYTDGDFPNVTNIEVKAAGYAEVDRDALAGAIDRASVLGGTSAGALLTWADGTVTVTVTTSDGGDDMVCTETVPADTSNLRPGFAVLTNAKYLRQLLLSLPEGTVRLSWDDNTRPLKGTSHKAPNVRQVLMPVRGPERMSADPNVAPEEAPALNAEPDTTAEVPADVEPEGTGSTVVARSTYGAAVIVAHVEHIDAPTNDVEPDTTADSDAPADVEPAPADVEPAPVAPVAVEPEATAEATVDAAATVAETGVPIARVVEILRTGQWSSAVVTLGRGRAKTRTVMDTFTLCAGWLRRPEFAAVAEVLRHNGGGTWHKAERAFVFEPSKAVYDNTYTRSGREALNLWLDRHDPATDGATDSAAETDTTAGVEPSEILPALDDAAERAAQVAYDKWAGGDHVGALAALSACAAVAPDGYRVGGLFTVGEIESMIRVGADVDTPAPAATADDAEPVDVADYVGDGTIPALVGASSGADGGAGAVRLAAGGSVVAVTATEPNMTPNRAESAGAVVAVTLAAYAPHVNGGGSYRASRKVIHAAVRAAGISATVRPAEDNRRGVVIESADADAVRVLDVVRSVVTLDTTTTAPDVD
jgi:DNA polymerase-3 subunit beta